MLSENSNPVPIKCLAIVGGVLLLQVAFVPQVGSAASVAELVAKAKEERALNVTVPSGLTGKTTQQLAAAFKKRFGLDIQTTITAIPNPESFPKAVSETKLGAVPTFDAIDGPDTNHMALFGVGGTQRVDNWTRLLEEINPLVRSGKVSPAQLSPGPLRGFAFAYLSWEKALLFNPKLISKDKLPKTHAELADPKYKGMWTQPPWTTHWEPGPMALPNFSREQWIEVVRNAGKNGGAVLVESAGVQRMLLGEFAFTMANSYYYFQYKAKDPKAPIDITFFQDFNVSSTGFYVVRKNASHPAAATLFALWMGTPEAERIWQGDASYTQLWGESDLDKKVRQVSQESNARIVAFLDSEKGLDFLRWIATEEGRKYKEALGRAIRGQ